MIGLEFPLGIIADAVWVNKAWYSKETWTLITWLIFASDLHAHLTKTGYGKKPKSLRSMCFITIWIYYLGVNFLEKGLHTYGKIV